MLEKISPDMNNFKTSLMHNLQHGRLSGTAETHKDVTGRDTFGIISSLKDLMKYFEKTDNLHWANIGSDSLIYLQYEGEREFRLIFWSEQFKIVKHATLFIITLGLFDGQLKAFWWMFVSLFWLLRRPSIQIDLEMAKLLSDSQCHFVSNFSGYNTTLCW